MRRMLVRACVVVVAAITLMVLGSEADAQSLGSRTLRKGHSGPDVREMQIRIAGWVNNCVGISCHTYFGLDGDFGGLTERSVKNFQKASGIGVDGVVGAQTHQKLRELEDSDRSTKHFNFAEFTEKAGECRTNNRGTFNGGPKPPGEIQETVRWLQHRLEVVRAKRDNQNAMYVWSGFRSNEYNECLRSKHGDSVAKNSIHRYGGAWDGTMANVSLGQQRGLAKTSQFHGIFCYSGGDKHNHFDIRKDIGQGDWVWPRTDSSGRDLTGAGNVCTGSQSSPPSTGTKPPAVGSALNPQSVLSVDAEVPDPDNEKNEIAPEEVWMKEDD